MGTDVYLKWNGQTKEDEKAQFTGFSCNAGDVGYLRASIGMARENHVLRVLFPDHWEGENKKPYDFKANWGKAVLLAMSYFLNCLTGKEFELFEEQKHQQEMGDLIMCTLAGAGWNEAGAGWNEAKVKQSKNDRGLSELAFGIMWFNSLLNFFELGIEKQEEGKKPYVWISW